MTSSLYHCHDARPVLELHGVTRIRGLKLFVSYSCLGPNSTKTMTDIRIKRKYLKHVTTARKCKQFLLFKILSVLTI